MKYLVRVLVFVVTFFPIYTFASSITNLNGIVISEEEYNDFSKIYSHDAIMHMSLEKYEKLKSLDFDNLTNETKYVATTYNRSLNLTTEREITKEEYENISAGSGIMPRLEDDGNYYETVAKQLTIDLVGGTYWNFVVVTNTWKGIPSTRSFDVIGIRGYGFEFRDGSQNGEQVYYLNDQYNYIDYAWNGTNIQRHDNGFGISMNIVNSDISFLQLSVECDVTPTIVEPTIYGAYEHAIANLSLADSQNYTLGPGGLGNVFIYPYSINEKYDGMSGVFLQY